MCLYFQCTDPLTKRSWQGRLSFAALRPYEIDIFACGSHFHMICDSYSFGNYICIPAAQIGASIASLDDFLWNTDHLLDSFPHVPRTDIITISSALCRLHGHLLL